MYGSINEKIHKSVMMFCDTCVTDQPGSATRVHGVFLNFERSLQNDGKYGEGADVGARCCLPCERIEMQRPRLPPDHRVGNVREFQFEAHEIIAFQRLALIVCPQPVFYLLVDHSGDAGSR